MGKFLTRVCFLLTLAATACVTDDDPVNNGVAVGDTLPQFSVALNDGTILSSASLHGKTSVIEFFNTGCPDCRESLPILQEVWLRYEGNPAVVVAAIAREETRTDIENYWRQENLTIPFSSQGDRTVYNLFATVGIPRIYVANSEGIIVKAYGPEDYSSLPDDLEEIIAP